MSNVRRQPRSFAVWGMLSGIGAAAVLFVFFSTRPSPRFAARACYVIDWDRMPGTREQKEAERKEVITKLANPDLLKLSEAIESNWKKHSTNQARTLGQTLDAVEGALHIATRQREGNLTEFRIEMFGDESAFAKEVVRLLIADAREMVDANASVDYVGANLNSMMSLGKAMDRKDALRRERAAQFRSDIGTSGNREPAKSRAQLETELAQAEMEHTIAGFNLLATLFGGTGSDALKVTEPIAVVAVPKPSSFTAAARALLLGGTFGLFVASVGALIGRRKGTARANPASSSPQAQTPPLIAVPPQIKVN